MNVIKHLEIGLVVEATVKDKHVYVPVTIQNDIYEVCVGTLPNEEYSWGNSTTVDGKYLVVVLNHLNSGRYVFGKKQLTSLFDWMRKEASDEELEEVYYNSKQNA